MRTLATILLTLAFGLAPLGCDDKKADEKKADDKKAEEKKAAGGW